MAVFPLSVRSPDVTPSKPAQATSKNPNYDAGIYWLIYEDLTKLGYRIGTPHCKADMTLYRCFLDALSEAIRYVHEAGVLHCDLYPSNIMWKQQLSSEGEMCVSIRIIDWDCAHCLDEGEFRGKIKRRVDSHRPTEGLAARFDEAYDWRYFVVLQSGLKNQEEQGQENNEEDGLWGALASNNKTEIDCAFFELFQRAALR